MNVRAKFIVDSIKRSNYSPKELCTVEMRPVTPSSDEEEENKKFWEATPSGSLELGCINPEAAEFFKLGEEYYLDFTLVKK